MCREREVFRLLGIAERLLGREMSSPKYSIHNEGFFHGLFIGEWDWEHFHFPAQHDNIFFLLCALTPKRGQWPSYCVNPWWLTILAQSWTLRSNSVRSHPFLPLFLYTILFLTSPIHFLPAPLLAQGCHLPAVHSSFILFPFNYHEIHLRGIASSSESSSFLCLGCWFNNNIFFNNKKKQTNFSSFPKSHFLKCKGSYYISYPTTVQICQSAVF